MATRDSSGVERRSARLGGNRPRTHPSSPLGTERRSETPTAIRSEVSSGVAQRNTLATVREQIAIAASAAAVCGAALAAQAADSDRDVAVVLQRCMGDVLARQVEQLDCLIAGGES